MPIDPTWLVLAYTLPPEPSRLRVSIWRRLRRLGAVYLDEGVWVFPNTERLAVEARSVLEDIASFRGQASAFIAQDFDGPQGDRLRAKFMAARDEEYAELRGQTERFMVHVEHATSTERYTFAEVEELEEEISKLERWLAEIRSRDLFTSPVALTCAQEIEQGRSALIEFTERAFAESGDASQGGVAPE